MKKLYLLFGVFALCGIFLFSSCEDDHDHETECSACHIALPDANGGEMIWDITNSSGSDQFCGDELEDAESSSYSYSVTDTLYSDDGNIPLLPGEYGPGSSNSSYEIHCEEHAH